jgi:hypothetical protein
MRVTYLKDILEQVGDWPEPAALLQPRDLGHGIQRRPGVKYRSIRDLEQRSQRVTPNQRCVEVRGHRCGGVKRRRRERREFFASERLCGDAPAAAAG